MPKRTFFRLDEDKRERVIRAAIDEFRKNGFENAKVGVIAQVANVANGSIYQYFDDKRELFLYCVNWTVENYIREIDRRIPLAAMDLFEYFQTGIMDRAGFARQEPELAMFAHDLTNGLIDFPPGEANPVRGLYGAHIPKLISNGHKWGALREDVGDEMLKTFFTGVAREAEEILYMSAASAGFALTDDQARDNKAFLDGMLDLLKNGLEMSQNTPTSTAS